MPREMKVYPISPTNWIFPGTSFGLAKAAQKKPTTISMQITARSIGLVKPKLPTEKIGLKLNELRPGAGKPQFALMWHPTSASILWALTRDSFVVTHKNSNLGCRRGW